MSNTIVFPAIVHKLQTLVDGGVRVTLDLAEDCIPQMAMLAEARREGVSLVFTAKAESDYLDGKDIADGRTERGRKTKKG